MGILPKATDFDAEDKRGVRKEVRGKGTGRVIYSNSKDEQEKGLQTWTNVLEKAAQEEERRLETLEKKRMEREYVQSRSRQTWDKIFQSIPNLLTKSQVAE